MTSPTRLDIKDLPRDSTRALGGLRQALCASFNYCRRYPTKLDLLEETLNTVLKAIREYRKELEGTAKVKLEEAARLDGIELNRSETLLNMQDAYDKALAIKAVKAEKAADALEPADNAPVEPASVVVPKATKASKLATLAATADK